MKNKTNNVMSFPNDGNIVLEKSRELLGNPNIGQSVAKPLKEDSDYLIFNNGRLFSLKSNKFLLGKIDNVGYRTFSLAIFNEMTGKKNKMFYAHRLVAEYFLSNDNPQEKIYVHHKDENKLNNHVDNLEWVTPSQNSQFHLLMSPRKSGIKPKYKLKDLPDEQWKIIQQNPLYSISNKGRVVNNKTNRLLVIDTSQKYSRISLNDKKHYYIHRLVYCTFNNDYDLNGYVIDHIDCNPRNNNLENLQKLTHTENNQRRFFKGTFNDYPPSGSTLQATGNGSARLL